VTRVALTPRLDSVEALFRKLEREGYRAFHHPDSTHKADHFYNFCVTAQSLREYLLERIGKVLPKERQPCDIRWSRNHVLVAVAEIANTAKHFRLRDRKKMLRVSKTRQVRHGRTTMAQVFLNSEGQLVVRKRTNVPTYYVEVDEGQTFELFEFIDVVINYWKVELGSHGVKLRRQSLKRLTGVPNSTMDRMR
jgi:hypothetical protein